MNIKVVLIAAMLASGMLAATGCANQEHRRSAGTVIDDGTLTTKVKSALLTEKDVKSFDIGVQTFEGVVQLSGFVNSQWQVDKAGQVARSVKGVQRVQNNLIHKPN